MTQPRPKGIWLDVQTHDALIEYAWLKRTTMSDVFRAILDHIGNEPVDKTILDVTDRPGRRRLAVKTTDEQWNNASLAASKAGVGFHSLIRRHIIHALQEEGLLE